VTYGQYVGAAMPAAGGEIAVVTMSGLAVVDGDALSPVVTVLERSSERLNDAAVDAAGRVWVDSTSLNGRPGAGALFSWAPEEGVRVHRTGMTLPNGIGWSRSGDVMYIADSGVSTMYRASFDPADGAIGELEPLYQVDDGEPDGLCVDEDDSLWVAVWNGSRIEHRSPDGELLQSIPMPVRRPTSCAAVPGRGLAITSAQYGLIDPEPEAGCLFLLPAELRGVPSGVMRL
jgi:sugar lactone lactonase YvrE